MFRNVLNVGHNIRLSNMKIEEKDSIIIISHWRKLFLFTKALVLLCLFVTSFFIIGLGAAILTSACFAIALLIGMIIDEIWNYSIVQIDFKKKKIDSITKFGGIILRRNLIECVDFRLLKFKEYQRGGGGLKKYVLEYDDRSSKGTVVFRVNHKKERDEILSKLKDR